MNFAEYYFMGGWYAVAFCSAVIGALYKFSWQWFYQRRYEILPQVIYITNLLFAYVLISRGPLVHITTIYFFTIMPTIIFYLKLRKK